MMTKTGSVHGLPTSYRLLYKPAGSSAAERQRVGNSEMNLEAANCLADLYVLRHGIRASGPSTFELQQLLIRHVFDTCA